MTLTIQYAAQLAGAAGASEETLEVEPGPLSALLRQLAEKHGSDFAKYLFTESGDPQPALLVVVDDEQVDREADPELRDGNRILLITPMAGG